MFRVWPKKRQPWRYDRALQSRDSTFYSKATQWVIHCLQIASKAITSEFGDSGLALSDTFQFLLYSLEVYSSILCSLDHSDVPRNQSLPPAAPPQTSMRLDLNLCTDPMAMNTIPKCILDVKSSVQQGPTASLQMALLYHKLGFYEPRMKQKRQSRHTCNPGLCCFILCFSGSAYTEAESSEEQL